MTSATRSWQQGAFYVGLTALAQRSKSERFREAIMRHGRDQQWKLGERRYHADDHVIGQSYIWAATHGAGMEAIAPTPGAAAMAGSSLASRGCSPFCRRTIRREQATKPCSKDAAKLGTLKKDDGYWSPSLIVPENTRPESSGTGFFVYGLAWGIDAGLLDRATYEPAVRRGWQALQRVVAKDGRLGWVQQVSDRPEQVLESDTQFYGVGAFLLAGSAVLDMTSRPAP